MDPRLDVSNIPYVVFDWDAAIKLYSPGGPIFDLIAGIGADVGWKVFGTYIQGWDLYMVKKVKFTPVPEDLRPRGLISRSMFMESDRLVTEAIGFKAIPMPSSEVEQALTTGTIDARAGEVPRGIVNWAGLCKYAYLYRTRPEIGLNMMNLRLYNSLSAEDKQIIQQAATKAVQFITNDVRSKEPIEIQAARDKGIEVIELTPEQLAANAKVTREKVWPALQAGIGKALMDKVIAYAQPIPGK
jgi:TRAP-type C4-dicarboxylate transport system substrate-binding protein